MPYLQARCLLLKIENNLSDLMDKTKYVSTDGWGDLIISKHYDVPIVCPEHIEGNLILEHSSAEQIVLPKRVDGNMYLDNLTTTKNLVLPKKIGGTISIDRLENPEGLMLPKRVKGALFLRSLVSAEGLKLPEYIKHSLYLNSITSARNLVLPQIVEGNIYLISLKCAEGMHFPNKIGGTIFGEFSIEIAGTIYMHIGGLVKIAEPPKNRAELGEWIKVLKGIYVTKNMLISVLEKLFNKEEANDLSDTILAGKMLAEK
jgi:hypothetical protein